MANDRYYGTTGDDTYDGGDGRDYILGDAGDDTLTGGSGRDIIRGGSGDDEIYGGEDVDIIRGDSGDDKIYGGEGADTLLGDEGADEVYGGEGDDTIAGGEGDDTLDGGAGEDTFVFSEKSGEDTVKNFSLTEDTIDLSLIPETITYDDLTIVQDGDNTKITVSHDDLEDDVTIILEGVTATELSSDNFVMPDPPADSVSTDTGHSIVRPVDPWEGNDFANTYIHNGDDSELYGKGGNDKIFGGEGDDDIYGGAGCDLLLGEEGDDTIDGGADDDTLVGGSGNDTFVFQSGHGDDTIKDFKDVSGGENDAIDLSAFSTITGFSDLSGKITQDGDDTKIDLSDFGGGEIILEDFTSSNLDASDFDFA